MGEPPDSLLTPAAVADWLEVDETWVHRAIEADGLPVLGTRSDGEPLLVASEVRAWLRRPSLTDDET